MNKSRHTLCVTTAIAALLSLSPLVAIAQTADDASGTVVQMPSSNTVGTGKPAVATTGSGGTATTATGVAVLTPSTATTTTGTVATATLGDKPLIVQPSGSAKNPAIVGTDSTTSTSIGVVNPVLTGGVSTGGGAIDPVGSVVTTNPLGGAITNTGVSTGTVGTVGTGTTGRPIRPLDPTRDPIGTVGTRPTLPNHQTGSGTVVNRPTPADDQTGTRPVDPQDPTKNPYEYDPDTAEEIVIKPMPKPKDPDVQVGDQTQKKN
ncbi:MAG: hypothetical protein ACK502_08720 [Alphaproteobacteria bacterium]